MKHYTDDELVDYLHGELSDARDALVHAHLAQCTDCRLRCDAEASVGDLLRASSLGRDREMPAMIRAQVWAAIDAAQPTFLERVRALVSPVVAVPFAAVLAFLLYLGVPVLRGNHATGSATVSALYYLEQHAAVGQENPLADHLSSNVSLAVQPSAPAASSPLIDAADAATLDDVVAARE